MNRVTALVFLSAILATTCSYFWRLESMPYFLEFEAKASSNSTAQLFTDYGNGFSEEGSIKKQIFPSDNFDKIRFNLKPKEITFLRFDPFISDGEMEIKSVRIRGRKQILNEYEILHEFDIIKIRAAQNVEVKKTKNKTIIVNSSFGNIDPVLELPIARTLNHWEIKDFLDEEWLKKSFFLLLTFTPIIISLSFLPVAKTNTLSYIKFSIRRDEIILKKGQEFTCSNSKDHYRDTNEDNLNSIIKSIEHGKEWRSVIKEKIASSNPWLNSIAISPKRTKFIEEFLKPRNLSVLDIGAGWGQFSIPLAKSNKVCSLEPTPERLNIIKSIAQQEKVSDNMYFIGTDYLDIEFQTKFDLILCIGVLEWMGSFRKEQSAGKVQRAFLKKSRSELSDKGKLVIGIENRLGLKYIMGARDDHHGFEDVMIYGEDFAERFFGEDYLDARRCIVHSLPEYEAMLRSAGFQNIKFFVAIPDYKLVEEIFPITESGSSYNDFLNNGNWIIEHDGIDGSPLPNQEKLQHLYKSLAKMNIAHLFAPSFFIEAS